MTTPEVIPVVRSSAFWPVVSELGRMGVPVESHLAAAGVPEEALSFPDLIVPKRSFWALLDGVRRREGVEDIGFRIGAATT